jgi:hypothetical protein
MTDILNSYYTPTHYCIVQKYTLIQDIFWRLVSEPTTGPSFFAPRHYPKRPAYARTAMPPAIPTLTSYLNVKDCKGYSVGMTIRIWVPDPTGMGTGIIFYPQVAPISDPNRDGYGTGIFFSPVGNPTGT